MKPERTTEFSACRKYRYTLWRQWGNVDFIKDLLCATERKRDQCEFIATRDQYLMVIGLNPSTADETNDDPTIRRCIQYAKDWGFGALCMTNLFAWRDTSPAKMKMEPLPIGRENDYWLNRIAADAGLVLAAWGNDGAYLNRADFVAAKLLALTSLHCLKINEATGQPKHPLYCAANLKPVRFALEHERK